MKKKTIGDLLREHPFFADLEPQVLDVVACCGQNVHFASGELLGREGQEASFFYALRKGRVAIETFVPSRGAVTIETVDAGGVVGWSWLVPPHLWVFDARAVLPVRAIAFDGQCLRSRCETDAAVGHALLRRFAGLLAERLRATRLRLLDVYGHAPR
ncbi:MAG: cyclic nucleotide-binding domain-containing protein [Myxococcales bacterium]|nr:cyclic nucleotide-binding domain-containing protein [Myxococcota bacterium]MDW8283692.1 cyclic nucleotide-binding domain-containing protein [Myxococcales bacterium]